VAVLGMEMERYHQVTPVIISLGPDIFCRYSSAVPGTLTSIALGESSAPQPPVGILTGRLEISTGGRKNGSFFH